MCCSAYLFQYSLTPLLVRRFFDIGHSVAFLAIVGEGNGRRKTHKSRYCAVPRWLRVDRRRSGTDGAEAVLHTTGQNLPITHMPCMSRTQGFMQSADTRGKYNYVPLSPSYTGADWCRYHRMA